MPKRTDISSILIIGAGPIIIGQACEFDYSGTQACKALREEGYKVILVNSNPATIMTDPETADVTYIEPITPEFIAKIIEKERPDALLPTVGGQTALNCALELAQMGVLDKFGVKMIGANKDAIEKAEDRKKFQDAMARIGLECPRSIIANSLDEALFGLDKVGLPAIIRPSFTLGGTGGGIAYTLQEYQDIVSTGLAASPTNQVLIDESVLGWKEYEMEVVRDKNDNCIIVCSIENIDPMGVHTGDSITVAPALTLTDKEYQIMRNASIAVLREIGVETGGSNVQFAINPADGRMLVIEMNPRVSRSSALASKATGFPIAKVAAKLAIGYTLDEIMNDCTKTTPASFEPVIDYIVTKIPRFAFEKFTSATKELSSSMKSVGEAMAIGRSFKESVQKALRSLEIGLNGFDEVLLPLDKVKALETLRRRIPDRILYVAQGFRQGLTLEEIQDSSKFDPWFLHQIKEIIELEQKIANKTIDISLPENMQFLKSQGFSDARIAKLLNITEDEARKKRYLLGIHPVYKRVDTCGAEFSSNTSYFYSTYEGDGINKSYNESTPTNKEKVVILGSGPNRIGQGIEFDYACVHASYELRDIGVESIMINCNPETVSTDYDTSDRLYFEPLTAEDVLEIIRLEASAGQMLGVNLQFGGQTPLKLAKTLNDNNINILGTSSSSIDLAEDRESFRDLLQKLSIKQPANYICKTVLEAKKVVAECGYPLVARPSYVLGGRAMEIIHDEEAMDAYLKRNQAFFEFGPILIDSFLSNAVEVDVDAISDGANVYVAGIMQHVEEAGVHSGDSACVLPSYSISQIMLTAIKDSTIKLAKALEVKGLLNIQYAIKDKILYVLEVNPRSSRTIPFVAKSIGLPLAKLATKIMLKKDVNLTNIELNYSKNYVTVKEAVFPFGRFDEEDVILGPEMKSTGEVMGIDINIDLAFAKAQIAAGQKVPATGNAFISVKDADKPYILELTRELDRLQFAIIATKGTAKFLEENGIKCISVNKVIEGSPHIVDMIKAGKVDFVINTSHGRQSIKDSFSIRRSTLIAKVAYCTTIEGAVRYISSIKALARNEKYGIKSIQEYHQS